MALQAPGGAGGIRRDNPGSGFMLHAPWWRLTAGTMFLMWLGEQITERGVGNGISLIIFAGIVAGLPGAVARHPRARPQRRPSPLSGLS